MHWLSTWFVATVFTDEKAIAISCLSRQYLLLSSFTLQWGCSLPTSSGAAHHSAIKYSGHLHYSARAALAATTGAETGTVRVLDSNSTDVRRSGHFHSDLCCFSGHHMYLQTERIPDTASARQRLPCANKKIWGVVCFITASCAWSVRKALQRHFHAPE